MMLRTIIISLASLLAVLISAALLALEPAEEFPAQWGCIAWNFDNEDLLCIAACQYYDGTQDFDAAPRWRCPGSNLDTSCVGTFCDTPEECRKYGFPYVPCHDVEKHVCKARAVRATQFACKVKTPGTAFNVGGDCVLRIRKNPLAEQTEDLRFVERTELRMDCWNPSDFAFAPDWWTPVHPETLVRHPPPLERN